MIETTFMGIRFFEGMPTVVHFIGPVRVEISGIITSSQLKSLDDVKRLMVEKARAKGGNAIVDFKYGQRSVGCLASLFMRDDVSWFGEGQIAYVSGSPERRSVQ